MRIVIHKIWVILVGIAMVHGPASAIGQSVGAVNPRATLFPCEIVGVPAPIRCGTISVPENRETSGGRRLSLKVTVLRATGPKRAADPVFMLAGGPGQAATDFAAAITGDFGALRHERDIVLVDQRGTGGSNQLSCSDGMAVFSGSVVTSVEACKANLENRADLTRYGTTDAVDDLEAVRSALGYERVNLIGISYGSRVAQVFARRYPDRVRTITLRAPVPMGYNILWDGPRMAERALRQLVDDCRVDRQCHEAFPQLGSAWDTLLVGLDGPPKVVRIAKAGAGDSAIVALDRELVTQTLYALELSAPTRQMLPFLITRASVNLAVLAPVAAQMRAALYGLPVGMYLSVVCTEDFPGLTQEQTADITLLFGGLSKPMLTACSIWPRGRLPRGFNEPAHWAGPALIISGELDPAVDWRAADALARTWPQARHIILPATAHGPMFPGCMSALLAKFIASGGDGEMRLECLNGLVLPPFRVK